MKIVILQNVGFNPALSVSLIFSIEKTNRIPLLSLFTLALILFMLKRASKRRVCHPFNARKI